MSGGDPRPAGSDHAVWDEFGSRLAVGLANMAVESFLILAIPANAAGGLPYVQFAHWGEGDRSDGLRAEAAGSNYPATDRELTPAQEKRLARLGWKHPAPADKTRNFVREWSTPAPVVDIAALVVRTLREVYGVTAPSELRYRYSSFGNVDVPDLELGLEPDERSPRPSSKPPARSATGSLAPIVEAGLRQWLGVDRLARDADGDYPIPVGSALVFVRAVEGQLPMVAIFSAILSDVDESPGLLAALNDINRRIHFARAFEVDRSLVIATELPAVDITADQIAFACIQLGGLADHLDDVLHGRFGGGFALDDRSTLIH